MTYWQFLALFLVPPLIVLAVLLRHEVDRLLAGTLVAVSLVALLYTGPWDNAIIVNGVWSYGRSQVMGIVIGHVPLEEFCFYVLQVLATGLLTAALLRGRRSH